MSYRRVIPRDLFNEAKLLKCLEQLYLMSERTGGLLVVEFPHEGDPTKDFAIEQDPGDGSIFAKHIVVHWRGRCVPCYTPLNSKRAYPLYGEIDGEQVQMLDDDGKLHTDLTDT